MLIGWLKSQFARAGNRDLTHHEPRSLNVVRYRCTTCQEIHAGLPALAFGAPAYYDQIPESERGSRAELTSDTCVIDGVNFFVRGCLAVPILGSSEQFEWGVWVSLSRPNFRRYLDFFEEDPPPGEGPYFGWLSNSVPHYPETLNLKAHVHLRPAGTRPSIELEPTDHPLAVHQRQGIDAHHLDEIVSEAMARTPMVYRTPDRGRAPESSQ